MFVKKPNKQSRHMKCQKSESINLIDIGKVVRKSSISRGLSESS